MAITNNYEDILASARKEIMNADHMLSVTFKVVPDPKLLVSVLAKLENGIKKAMIAMLYYEKNTQIKDLDIKEFALVFRLFKERCFRKYRINAKHIEAIYEISEIVRKHKESPFEFRRDGKFVIMEDGSHRMQIVSIVDVKKYVETIKYFLFDVVKVFRG